jgi:hypothetical protein
MRYATVENNAAALTITSDFQEKEEGDSELGW